MGLGLGKLHEFVVKAAIAGLSVWFIAYALVCALGGPFP
jgi:hypothetical protein